MEHFFKDTYELGMWELRSDTLFDKIPKEQYKELIDFAWQIGIETAKSYTEVLKTSIPSEMVKKLGLKVVEVDKKFGIPEYRIYSEYYSNLKKIVLYSTVIDEAFQKIDEKYKESILDYSMMKELFLAHEIYHHLECHNIGLTSKKKKITTFQLGPIKITSGIRALCEIGAHSFTKTLIGGLS